MSLTSVSIAVVGPELAEKVVCACGAVDVGTEYAADDAQAAEAADAEVNMSDDEDEEEDEEHVAAEAVARTVADVADVVVGDVVADAGASKLVSQQASHQASLSCTLLAKKKGTDIVVTAEHPRKILRMCSHSSSVWPVRSGKAPGGGGGGPVTCLGHAIPPLPSPLPLPSSSPSPLPPPTRAVRLVRAQGVMVQDCDVYVGPTCRLRARLGCFVYRCALPPILHYHQGQALDAYQAVVTEALVHHPAWTRALYGCRLGCWCTEAKTCHAYMLASVVNCLFSMIKSG